jgi:phasin
MLLLLFKNFLWAAWWPYCTMLLAMEKATQQMGQGAATPPSAPRASAPTRADRGQGRQQERDMASDAFKPEIPEPLRELMKMSIEQAKRAFEAFIATSEKAWRSLESSSPSGRAGLYALNAKVAEITRRNAEANFALAMRLAEIKDVREALELQNRHVREQMETFVHQLEEMRDLTTQIVQEANPTRTSTPSGGARPGLSAVSPSPYAPSSSYPPGETGRTY